MGNTHNTATKSRDIRWNVVSQRTGKAMRSNGVRASFIASITQTFPKSEGFAGEATALVESRPAGKLALVMKNWCHVTRVNGDIYKVTAGFVGDSAIAGPRKTDTVLTWTVDSHGVDLVEFVTNITDQDHQKGLRLTCKKV